ncbi:MAG: hypothetical protein P8X50_12565 [Maritimibacter sp.]
MRAWGDLTSEEQLELRLAYQAHLDSQPRTCSMDDKISAFANWLVAREVLFSREDLSRR